jgi:carboxypeptidase family protein
MRANPGLQQFMPKTERRLLAKQIARSDDDEPPAVPRDHPFAKTRITGRVFDIETGAGIGGALVRIKPTFGAPRLGTPAGDGSVAYTTQSDGSYAMKGIPPGTFDLEVSASGFTPARSSFKKFSALEDDDGFDVGLLHGGTLEGRVLTRAGEPIAGAQVYATASEAISIHKDSTLASTDASGRFILDPVDARALHLYAAHPKYGSAVLTLPAGDGFERHVEVILRSRTELRGHVRDADGPVAGALVTVALQRVEERLVSLSAEAKFSGVRTDHDGAFELTVADSDPVVVIVRAAGYEQASHLVGEGAGVRRNTVSRHGARAIDEGEDGPLIRDIEIVLEQAYEFTGQVLGSDGAPALKAEVIVTQSTPRGRRPAIIAWTDGQGRFRAEGVPKTGPYSVTIRHFAHPPLIVTEEDIRGDHRYRLEPQARILGSIVDAASGRPVPKYQYTVSGPLRRQASAVSVSGAFEVDQLPPGTYSLAFDAAGYEPGSIESVSVESGETMRNLVVRMKQAGSIVGRIQGGALAGVVIVRARDRDSRLEAEAVVSEDGGFSFDDLPSGSYTLTAVGDGEQGELRGEIQDVRVESGGVTRNIDIVLAPAPTESDPG